MCTKWVLRTVLALAATLAVGCATVPENSILRASHLKKYPAQFCYELHELQSDIDSLLFGIERPE